MLETARTILRKVKEDDAYAIYHNWTSKDEVTKYLTLPTHTSIDTTKRIVKKWLEDRNDPDHYRYMIVYKENNQVIGMIDVVNYINDCPEIGYVLSPDYWNQGIMSEVFSKAMKTYLQDTKPFIFVL